MISVHVRMKIQPETSSPKTFSLLYIREKKKKRDESSQHSPVTCQSTTTPMLVPKDSLLNCGYNPEVERLRETEYPQLQGRFNPHIHIGKISSDITGLKKPRTSIILAQQFILHLSSNRVLVFSKPSFLEIHIQAPLLLH